MTYILPVIFFLLLLIGLIARISLVTYLLFIFPVFGSLALLPPDLVGGSSLTPGSFAAFFFVAKAMSTPGVSREAIRSATSPRRLGVLFYFMVIAVLGSVVMPRVFEGTVHVITMRTAEYQFVAPSAANYTQAAYLMLSTLVALCTAALIQKSERFLNILLQAILYGAYAVIGTGLMDIAGHLTGTEGVLAYFRTANYVFMTENYIEGARRIIGLMPEASAYGGTAAIMCGLLLFLRPAYPQNLFRFKVPVAGWGCGAMALLSTSSTAYVMMALVLGLYTFYGTHRVMPDGRVIKKPLSKKILAVISAGILLLLILIFDQSIAERFAHLVDVLIFEKQKSSSYVDRTRLTLIAIDTFFDSWGFGVGVGSVRASNFFVVLLASTGVLGTGLFLWFLWINFRQHALAVETRANVIIRACKLALIPTFAGATLAATTPDFGPVVGVLFGLIAGLSQPSDKTKWVSPHVLRRQNEDNKPKRSHRP